METQQHVEPNLKKGSFLIVIAFLLMAVFGVLTKVASLKSSPIWVSFLTYLTAFLLTFTYAISTQGIHFYKTQHPLLNFIRGFFGLMASFVYMLSMKDIPIVNATLLFNTAPLFIPFLSMYFHKTHIHKTIWLALVLGFIGIIIIIKPTTEIFGQAGDLLGLVSGISLAVAYFSIKELTQYDSPLKIIFYYFFLGTIFQIPLLFWAGPLVFTQYTVIAIVAGITLLAAQTFLTEAYKYADASQIGVFQYTSVIFVGIIDWIIWGVIPPLSDLIGVFLVIVAGIIVIKYGPAFKKQLKN